MSIALISPRSWMALAGIFICAGFSATAQDSSSPSLGDVARKTRQEHASADHVAGKQLLSEEDDGPDSTGVWRLRTCVTAVACYELSVSLPKTPRWIRATGEPRRVLIPLQGYEQDRSHAIRLYAAEGLAPRDTLDVARRTLLQSWFSRPEYFGREARLELDEHTSMNATALVITRFNVPGSPVKYRGLSVVANAFDASHAFACAFRDDDATEAGSVCDAIIKSAQSQMLLPPPKPAPVPSYHTPPRYYPGEFPEDDSSQDPPGDNDPD